MMMKDVEIEDSWADEAMQVQTMKTK